LLDLFLYLFRINWCVDLRPLLLPVHLDVLRPCILPALVDLQADKSPVVVKGPFIPRVVNPRYRIRGTMRDARVDLRKQET
jgi:hypothetical protein